MMNDPFKIFQLNNTHFEALTDFFISIDVPEVTRYFHPHGFTQEDAYRIVHYTGPDIYAALSVHGTIKVYGMLRGWEDGYETPSLGICVDPSALRQGFGKIMMHHLHVMARSRGARSVMLRVFGANEAAIKLYQHLGYQQAGCRDGQLLYTKCLEKM